MAAGTGRNAVQHAQKREYTLNKQTITFICLATRLSDANCSTLALKIGLDALQAMGERDATQAEQISGFAEKPLGFYDTSHIIRCRASCRTGCLRITKLASYTRAQY